jgi:hypothetical protein
VSDPSELVLRQLIRYRGHVRPLLHLTIQLLLLHPNLRVTYLLSPAVDARIQAELASTNLAYVHDGSGRSNVLERMQLVPVSPNEKSDAPEVLLTDMAAKAELYAQAIGAYFAALFGRADGKGMFDNKFKDAKPTCVIFDVSDHSRR